MEETLNAKTLALASVILLALVVWIGVLRRPGNRK